jgi:hypothetical protein
MLEEEYVAVLLCVERYKSPWPATRGKLWRACVIKDGNFVVYVKDDMFEIIVKAAGRSHVCLSCAIHEFIVIW